MRFILNKSDLQTVLSTVSKGISSRSTLPALSGIFIETMQDSIVLQSTNLELSIKCSVAALIEESGKVVVPGKLFSDIIKSLPDAAITVDCQEGSAIVHCNNTAFSIKALDPEDFPEFPHVDIKQTVSIPFPIFSSLVKKVARVVSREENRPVLNGALISVGEGSLKVVATDSYRLSVAETSFENDFAEFEAIIAGTFLLDIASLPCEDKEVTLSLAENQVVITYNGTTFINRRIEGSYPNYRQLLPTEYKTRVEVDRDKFLAAVKRVSLLGDASSPTKITVDKEENLITLSTFSQEVGSAEEKIPCNCEGEDQVIAFNSAYLIEGLSIIDSETVFLDLVETMKQGIIREVSERKYLYLIMPVRIS